MPNHGPGYWQAVFKWDGEETVVTDKTETTEYSETVSRCDGEARLPRGVNALQLSQDTVVAGETTTIYIRGGFPETPATTEVCIKREGVTMDGWVDVPSLRVVTENLMDATLWRSIECTVDIPPDADVGLYDIEVTCNDGAGEGVDGYVMDEVLNVLKLDYEPKSGPFGTPIRIFLDPPSAVDWASDSVAVSFTGKFVPAAGYPETSETTISYPAEEVYYDPAKPDEVWIIVGDVMPGAEFIADHPQLFLADSVTVVGTLTVGSGTETLATHFDFDIVPSATVGEIVEGTYEPISTIDLRNRRTYDLVARVLLAKQDMETPPETIKVKIQAVDEFGNDIVEAPSGHAAASRQLVAHKLATTTVPGFFEYRTSVEEMFSPWGARIPPDVSPHEVPWVYVVDGGSISIKVRE